MGKKFLDLIFALSSSIVIVLLFLLLSQNLSHAQISPTTAPLDNNATLATLSYDSCEEGEWKQLSSTNDGLYYLYGSRVTQLPENNDLNADLNAYFAEACPTESLLRSCYFHTDKNYSTIQLLEMRKFKPKNPKCLQFEPFGFLELIRNRRIIMLGDSIMTQIFASLVCALYRVTYSTYDMDFHKLWGSQCNEINCPFGQGKHSHLLGGWINFPLVNASIVQVGQYNFNYQEVSGHLKRITIPLTKHDIVIYNFGIHYNNEDEFKYAIKDLKADFPNLLATFSEDRNNQPQWFFLGTTPQHFDTPKTGYYKQETKDYHKTYCDPFANETETFEADWRNRMAEKALVGFHDHLHYIPMARGMYSQYDVHVGLEPLPYAPIDCTHWCYPSNIFKYVHMIIYNALKKHIRALPSNRIQEETVDVPYMLPPYTKEGLLLKSVEGSNSIYLIENGKLREFQTHVAVTNHGYSMSHVKHLSPHEFRSIPKGEDIV